jgi:predicted RNase H-like HicB family nuclease
MKVEGYSADNSGRVFIGEVDTPTAAYRCHFGYIREDDGTYSVLVINLPGAGSCGDTIEDATVNAREAVAGAIEAYQSMGQDVPWDNEAAVEGLEFDKWVTVHLTPTP